MRNEIYNYLKDKKVLLLGFGKEGLSTYQFIRSMDNDMKIGVSDIAEIKEVCLLEDSNVTLFSGDNYLECCFEYDIIIKGPGVIIKDKIDDKTKEKITCQTDLFIRFCGNKTIGITGTKGKSTTSSLMHHILNVLNKESLLMGNIGIPCFDMIDSLTKNTICVLELGVHQLEFMRHSPDIGVILNVSEEHLDHYVSYNAYIEAKRNIYRYQNQDNYILLGDSSELRIDNTGSGKLITGYKSIDNCFYLEIDDLVITFNNKVKRIPISSIKTLLKGRHNLYNILVCLMIVEILNLDIDDAINSISTFNSLPHRLEYVGKYNDIYFYDDAIATSISAVINAVETLKDVDTIIIGGMDRGIDYSKLVIYLSQSSVNNIILISETAERICKLFLDNNISKNILKAKSLNDAVDVCFEVTEKDKICILSPAAASYGDYKNFEEKGNHFQELVKEMKDKKD